MTFKKSLALVSAAAVALSAIAPSLTSAASEFLGYAEKLASANVISAQSSEAGYRLSDKITRAEVAKIAANVAKLDVSATSTSFNDVSSAFAGYVAALVKVGAVNGSAISFRSNANITRFEALKILVKATGLTVSEASTNNFSDVSAGEVRNVVEAALANGLISANAFFRPNDSITRGEFFKIAANTIKEDNSDLGDLLGNLFGTGTTTITGSTTTTSTVTAAGELQISLNNASTSAKTIPAAGTIRFAVVDFAAGSSDITLNSIELKKVGLSSLNSSKVWFEKNGLRTSGKSSFTSENNASISFAPALVVKAGTVETLDLYVELDGNTGDEYQIQSGVISSSAKTVSGSFMTAVLRAASYEVAGATLTSASNGSDYKASNDVVELGAFKVEVTKAPSSSDTRDMVLQSATFFQSGSAALTNLSNIVLVRNGVTVSKSASVDGKALTFGIVDAIKDGSTATYYIKAVISNVENSSDQYQFRVKNTSDINVIEASTGFRATVTGTPVAKLYTVNGGDVKFERDSAVALSQNVAPGTEVVLMQGTITAKNAIQLEDVNLSYTVSDGYYLNTLFSTVYLKIGSSTFSASAPADDAATMEFLGSVTVNGATPVKLYGTLKSGTSVPAATVKFNEMKLSSFMGTKEYVSNQETVTSAVGSISGVSLRVDATTLNVSRNDNLGSSNLASGSKAVTVYGVALSSSKGNPIAVTNASFKFEGTGALADNVYATLYINGTAVDSETVTASNMAAVKFEGFTAEVSSSKTVNLVVKADLSDSFSAGNLRVTLDNLAAVDTVSSKDITSFSKPVGATFTIATASALFASADANPSAKLILAGSQKNDLFAFKVTAKNDAVKVKDLTFGGANLGSFSNFRLLDSGKNVIATSSSESVTAVTFESANGASILMDKSATYYVAADANSSTNSTGSYLTLTDAVITASNGTEYPIVASLSSNVHGVAENVGTIAKASNGSKEISSSALRFTVTVDANSKDSLAMSSISLENLLSGYTGSTVVKVYKDSVSGQNLAGTGLVNDATIALNLNNKNTVDAGSSVTYIVALDGAIIDSAVSGTSSWTVKLTDVTFSTGIKASQFINLGTFPITEVK